MTIIDPLLLNLFIPAHYKAAVAPSGGLNKELQVKEQFGQSDSIPHK